MRFRRLEITAFGALREVTSGEEPLGALVVVEGRNEAGKTSVFEFLCSLLYGIYPTSPERHPFAPWDGSELGGAARIRLADGSDVEVSRRLLSSPTATLERGGRVDALRNDDLPFVGHVPLKVFRQVYALRASELAGLDDAGWEAIEDRLLGRLGATDLRSAREVVTELENEARALWRPDRRGNPRVRVLGQAIRDVVSRRPEVRERAQHRRQAADHLTETRRVLASAQAARDADKARLERLRVFVPVRTELAHIAELRSQAGDAARLHGVPSDPVAELDRLQERVESALRDVGASRDARAESRADVDAFTDDDDALLARAMEIEAFRSRVAAAESQRSQLAGVTQECRGLQRRLRDASDRLPWAEEATPQTLEVIPGRAFSEAWARWVRAHSRVAASPTTLMPSEAVPPATASDRGVEAVILGVGIAGGVTVALGATGAGPFSDLPATWLALAGAAAVALIAAGVVRVRSRLRGDAARSDAVVAAARTAEELRLEEEQARSIVADMLAPAGLRPGSEPDPRLPTQIERCLQWLRDESDLHARADEIRTTLAAIDEEARTLSTLVERAPGDAAAVAMILHGRLQEARDRASSAERARTRLGRLDEAHADAEGRFNAAREALAEFERRLAPFGDDPRSAAAEVARRLKAHREAEHRLSRLRAEHPDLEHIRGELESASNRGDGWRTEPDPVAKLQDDLDDRGVKIEEWIARKSELEARLEAPEDDETLADLEGELLRLREERQRAKRAHDRLWILAQLVDLADQAVRDEHQPEILRLAGMHLEALTDGRYDRLEIAHDGGRTLQVSGPATARPLAVGPPLSTGTREQVYVAMRIALARTLDADGERLPLFLDEILVNWDPERRRRGLDLLEQTSLERQVFLFTCHPDLADEAVARGATRWRLDRP